MKIEHAQTDVTRVYKARLLVICLWVAGDRAKLFKRAGMAGEGGGSWADLTLSSTVDKVSQAAPQRRRAACRYHSARTTGRRGRGAALQLVYIRWKSMCLTYVRLLFSAAGASLVFAITAVV